MEDRIVERLHNIEAVFFGTHEVEGLGRVDLWAQMETYAYKPLQEWLETEKHQIVRKCRMNDCPLYVIVDKPDAVAHYCESCGVRAKKAQIAADRFAEKMRKKRERVGRLAAEMRKYYPTWNARKARNKGFIYINKYRDDLTEREAIDRIAIQFNLKMGNFCAAENSDDRTRKKVDFRDLNPLKKEFF